MHRIRQSYEWLLGIGAKGWASVRDRTMKGKGGAGSEGKGKGGETNEGKGKKGWAAVREGYVIIIFCHLYGHLYGWASVIAGLSCFWNQFTADSMRYCMHSSEHHSIRPSVKDGRAELIN